MTRRLFGMTAMVYGPVMAIAGVVLLMLWFWLCAYTGQTPAFAGIAGGIGLAAYAKGMAMTFVSFAKDRKGEVRIP